MTHPTRQHGYILLPVVLAITLIAIIVFAMNWEGAMNVKMAATEMQADAARYVAEAGLHHANWLLQRSNCTGYSDIPPGTPFGKHSYGVTIAPTSGSPISVTATATSADGATWSLRRDNIRVDQPPTNEPLQPGPVDSKDSFVKAKSNDPNHGSLDYVVVDSEPKVQFTLLEFSLADIPAQGQILAAELTLYGFDVDAGTDAVVSVYRITEPWTEAGVTYQTSDGSTAWTWPDNYEGANGIATTSISSGSGWDSWDVSSLVSAWHDGLYPNFGMVLVGNSDVYYAGYKSSEASDPALRPKLTITYTCECGVNCGGAG